MKSIHLMILGTIFIFWARTYSVQFSHSVVSNYLCPYGLQHTRLCCPSPTPGACSNSYPSSQWYHPTISSSVDPSPPAFNLSSIRVFSNESVLCITWPKYWSFNSASVLPMTIQDWFPLGLKLLSGSLNLFWTFQKSELMLNLKWTH